MGQQQHRDALRDYERRIFGRALENDDDQEGEEDEEEEAKEAATGKVLGSDSARSTAATAAAAASSSSSASSFSSSSESESKTLELEPDDGAFVLASNLAKTTTAEALRSHMAQGVAGRVLAVELLLAGGTRPLGCGVVTFSDAAGAEKAIAELNGTELDGSKIAVRSDARAPP